MTAQQDFLVAHIETIEQACSSVWQLHPQLIVDTTKVGLVRSALSLLDGCNSELDFKLNLMKGLVCNFKDQTREQIYQEIVVKP